MIWAIKRVKKNTTPHLIAALQGVKCKKIFPIAGHITDEEEK
jgi:hypothetical protein